MISILTQRALKLTALSAVKARRRFRGEGISEPTIYYFGYGANLSPQRFDKYEMNVRPVGVARLEGHALRFSLPCEYLGKGFASADPATGKEVWGFLYRMDRLSLWLLDIMEWAVMGQYLRVAGTVKTGDGKEYVAQFYQSHHPREGLVPSKGYRELILESARKHAFPAEYLAEIEKVGAKETFELDPGFSFLRPHRRRVLEKWLRGPYLWHDRVREYVSEKLRF